MTFFCHISTIVDLLASSRLVDATYYRESQRIVRIPEKSSKNVKHAHSSHAIYRRRAQQRRLETNMMIKPRSIDPQAPETARPTIQMPKNDRPFNGWGPRVSY
jgi:hypothetical protein